MSKILESKEHFYITTPIYYVNANPHIGTLYSTLIADILARRAREKNLQTFFLTGLDEHGQKIAQAAANASMDPQTFVDSMTDKFKEVWKLFDISYDFFIRTTDNKHKKSVVAAVEKLLHSGQIYKSNYYGYYCLPCETFVPGQESKSEQIVLCQTCNREAHWNSEEAYFFKLSDYSERIMEFYKNNPGFVTPEARLQEAIAFVKSGLKDLCISRKTNKWGIPFPNDPEHTIYVWIDALINYISALGFGLEEFNSNPFWPADVHVLAKDIVKFHAVFWPAILMALGLNMPKRLLVHGYILVDGDKMSKSKGNSINPETLAQNYGVDQVRYYLARKMAISGDGSFSTQDLEETISSELANNLGNLVSRVCAVADKKGVWQIQEVAITDSDLTAFQDQLEQALEKSDQLFDSFQIHLAITELFGHLSHANALVQKMQPWRQDFSGNLLAQLLWVLCNSIAKICTALSCVMPTKCAEILKTIGYKKETGSHFTVKKIETPLFQKEFAKPQEVSGLEKQSKNDQQVSPVNKGKELDLISFDEFAKVKIAVGKIESCSEVAGSDKLYKLMVNFGDFGIRQVLSGIKKYFTPEMLIGQQACFVLNLQPRKIMGMDSNGMILTAQDENKKVILVTPKESSINGFILQ